MANIRTFKNTQDETLAWLDEAGDTDVTLTLVKQAIRAAHEKRLTDERWPFMLVRPRTFSTTIGKQTYSLDSELLRLQYVKNLTTGLFLDEYTDQNVLQSGYDFSTDTDAATRFAMWGISEFISQPLAASTIAVSSTQAGDNGTNCTVTLRGYSGGAMVSETINCGGTSTNSYTELIKVTKSDNWTGTMTLRSDAAATINLQLGPTEYGRSYPQFYLLANTSEVDSLEYRFYRQPSPLVANNDRADYPPPFEELLVWETLCDLAVYNTYSDTMVAYWTKKKADLDLAMRQTWAEPQTINQAAVYTNYIER